MSTAPQGPVGSFFSNIFGRSDGGGAAPAVPDAHLQPARDPALDNQRPTNNTSADPSRTPEPGSPMDSWKDLWNPTPTDPKAPVDGTLPSNMFAGVDPAKMLDSARKIDFAKSIPSEVLAKITAGGPEAAAAFATALNDIGQRSYAQSSFAATKIVEAALAKFQEGVDARLPSQIRNHQVSQTIRDSNPALQHPAAAPIIDALQAQMAVKYPTATPVEIRDMATQYLIQFSALANPAPAASSVKPAEDWGKFFQ